VKSFFIVNRIIQLESMLRERDRRLEELTLEKRNLEKITRDQQRELEGYHKEEENQVKVSSLMSQLTQLRLKLMLKM
jgi:hypothetical protein